MEQLRAGAEPPQHYHPCAILPQRHPHSHDISDTRCPLALALTPHTGHVPFQHLLPAGCRGTVAQTSFCHPVLAGSFPVQKHKPLLQRAMRGSAPRCILQPLRAPLKAKGWGHPCGCRHPPLCQLCEKRRCRLRPVLLAMSCARSSKLRMNMMTAPSSFFTGTTSTRQRKQEAAEQRLDQGLCTTTPQHTTALGL